MTYSCRLFRSIDDIDPAEWQRIVAAAGRGSVSMDRRFIAAIETGMKGNCAFWHVIVDDELGTAVACATISAFTLDLANLAHPGLTAILRRLPGALSWMRHLPLLICGLPVSLGEHSLALAVRDDSPRVLPALDEVAVRLAKETRSQVIIYKEFTDADLGWTAPLFACGYRPLPSLPMHFFDPAFPSFDRYLSALRSHYRYKINRSIRKMTETSIEKSILNDTRSILDRYTPEVHELYFQVLERSRTRFETLPIEFFQELTRRFAGQVDLVILTRGTKIIAFGWCLTVDSICYMLYCGLDYAMNAELDLYFNLMYAWLDCAMRKQVANIVVGQTSDDFKARIGCYSRPRHAFTRGLNPVSWLGSRFGASLMVAREAAPRATHVFKSAAAR
jgi:predicted N-acyltransferase